MTTYCIRITTFGREYRTSGAVSLKVASNPVRAAALALLQAGASPTDKLAATGDTVSLTPMTLAALVKPHIAPKGWDRGRDRM
jgi:hypothetical protein